MCTLKILFQIKTLDKYNQNNIFITRRQLKYWNISNKCVSHFHCIFFLKCKHVDKKNIFSLTHGHALSKMLMFQYVIISPMSIYFLFLAFYFRNYNPCFHGERCLPVLASLLRVRMTLRM